MKWPSLLAATVLVIGRPWCQFQWKNSQDASSGFLLFFVFSVFTNKYTTLQWYRKTDHNMKQECKLFVLTFQQSCLSVVPKRSLSSSLQCSNVQQIIYLTHYCHPLDNCITALELNCSQYTSDLYAIIMCILELNNDNCCPQLSNILTMNKRYNILPPWRQSLINF